MTNSGAAASGSYDFQFRLFSRTTGGDAVGSIVSVPNVAVTNGVFTVPLDFGFSALNTLGSRFLEIGVKPSGASGAYTTLAPRQPSTDAPSAVFAFKALEASNAGRFNNLTIENFVQNSDARLSDARAPIAGSGNYIQNTTARQADSNFNISGNGIVGGNLTADTISANSNFNVVLTGQSTSNIGTWLNLNNTSIGGGSWSLISAGSANGEGAGNLLFYKGGTRMILSTSGLNLFGTVSADGANFRGGVFARGGAPGASGTSNNGYAFSGTGDNDSGLFSEGNGLVSLYTNAAERVRVTDGGLQVFGALTANTKSFQIDHPLDPLNKVLNYTSVESPDMKNIFDGNALTDDKGEAVVRLPAYFDALNRDFRYQLTVIGVFAQAIVAEEINGNQFKIRTDKPNVKVSWQITGIRRDPYAEDNRQPVEENKSPQQRGKCLYEPACAPKQAKSAEMKR